MNTMRDLLKISAKCWFLLLCFTTLTGCWDVEELKDQAFIIGMGIDNAEEGIELSLLEVLTNVTSEDQEGQGNTVSGNPNTRVVSAKGASITHCIEVLRSEIEGRINLSKIRFIIFGEEVLKAGILEHMDFILRHHEIEKTAQIIVAKPNSKELLSKEKGKLYPFLKIEKSSPLLHTIQLWQLAPKLFTEREGAVIQVIEVGDEKFVNVGVALLLLDKQQHMIEHEKVRWINVLKKKNQKKMKLFLEDELSFEIRKLKKTLLVQKNKVTITINVNGWIVQSKISNPVEQTKQLERKLSETTSRQIEDVLNTSKKHGVDILGIGEKFRQKNWDTTDWVDKLKELEFEVKVNIRILSGNSGSD